MIKSLNSFEFHWKGTTPTRCTRADKYSPPERDAARYLTHEARALKHYIKMSMQAVAGTCTRRKISCPYLTLLLCSLGLCYCSDLLCERIRFDTSRWSAVILLCGIILRTFDSSSFTTRSAARVGGYRPSRWQETSLRPLPASLAELEPQGPSDVNLPPTGVRLCQLRLPAFGSATGSGGPQRRQWHVRLWCRVETGAGLDRRSGVPAARTQRHPAGRVCARACASGFPGAWA